MWIWLYKGRSENNASKGFFLLVWCCIQCVMMWGENLNIATDMLQVSSLNARWQGCSSVQKWRVTLMSLWSSGVYWVPQNTASIVVHRCLRNIYRDMTVDVSTAKQWVWHVINGGIVMKAMPRSGCSHTAVTAENESESTWSWKPTY
jgi:hypothetical protein